MSEYGLIFFLGMLFGFGLGIEVARKIVKHNWRQHELAHPGGK